jgi:lipopolysaccharide/colanic/teichoic acid biosynthesis glycosyltransferase
MLWLAMLFIVSSWGSPYLDWGNLDSSLLLLAAGFSVAFVLFSLGLGQYERVRRFSITKIVFNTLMATAFSLMFSLSITYFLAYSVFGRLNLLWGAGGSFLSIILLRLCFALIFRMLPYRFTTLGKSELIDDIVSFVSNARHKESKYFQFIPCPQETGDSAKFWEFFSQNRIHDIVVSQDYLDNHANQEMVLSALENGLRLINEEHFYSDFFECAPLNRLTPSNLVSSDLSVRKLLYEATKRFFDITFSFTALIMLFPVLLVISIAIKLGSEGTVFFVQPRQGRFRKPFAMYKFRTMRQDLSCPDASGGFTQTNDSRVTWIGKILRPLHFDELPQLWNILKGDMSLVGPRPEALAFARKMSQQVDLYDLRYTARPGLTGHAQLLAGTISRINLYC